MPRGLRGAAACGGAVGRCGPPAVGHDLYSCGARASRSPRDEPKWLANIGAARAALGDAAFDAAWSKGEQWAFDDAIEYILESMAASAQSGWCQ